MAGFKLKVEGMDRVQKVFYKLPGQAQKELSAEIQVTANEIRDAAKLAAPKDMARLQNAISSKKVGPLKFETSAQTTYAAYVEFGTKKKVQVPPGLESVARQFKGPAPGQGDPVKALEGWVKRKGFAGAYNVRTRRLSRGKNSLENIREAARRLWFYIRRYGINPQPYFFKQMAPAERKLKNRVANVISKLI